MGSCGRASIVLGENLHVDVITDFDNMLAIETLERQCLVEDNPGRVAILVHGRPDEAKADLVIVLRGSRDYPFGFLARVVDTLSKSGGQSATYENASAYWR